MNQFQDKLKSFMADYGIISAAQLARTLNEPGRTVQDWISGRCIPKKHKRRRIYDRMENLSKSLPSQSDSANADLVPEKKLSEVLISTDQMPRAKISIDLGVAKIMELNKLLKQLIDGDENTRKEFRKRLGDDFEYFINLSRALSSETARNTVLRENLPLEKK